MLLLLAPPRAPGTLPSCLSTTVSIQNPIHSLKLCWFSNKQHYLSLDCYTVWSPSAPQTICETGFLIEAVQCDSVSWLFLYCHCFSWLLCQISLLRIFRNSSCQLLFSLSRLENLILLFDFCAACMLPYRCLRIDWWAVLLSLRSLHY